ncbi:MAG TPA: DUF5668 domain-containing protein, partial [Anaerolineales bacterium]|nr:DUF5668 domain-containing protein [Anaerolineales bacterium]
MSMDRKYRRGSLVWPILLVGLGVVFLLNNLGIISWNVWSLLVRMWPVLLVAVGLDLLFGRRSGVGAAIAALVMIGLFAGFFWALNATGDLWYEEPVTESIVYELDGGEKATVRIDQNVGELLVGSLDDDNVLFVRGEVIVSEVERLERSFEVDDGVIDFSLSSKGQQYYPGWIFTNNGMGDKTWRLNFSRDVLLDLQLDNGVGRTELDLTELSLSSLDVNGGVGEVVVTLPENGVYRVTINAGVGKIEVRVPDSMAA